MADPPITQAVREGNPVDGLLGPSHDDGQDASLEKLSAMMAEVMRWANVVTEVLNRELAPAVAANREMVNSRHGAYQLINDSSGDLTQAELTIDENIEFAACLNCDDVYLPRLAGHPGVLHIWVNQVTTFHAFVPDVQTNFYRKDQIDNANTMTTDFGSGVSLFNDGASYGTALFPTWYSVKGEA